MSEYRKLVAAAVGLGLLLLARHGIDLTGQQSAIVDLVLAVGTAAGVWAVRNEGAS